MKLRGWRVVLQVWVHCIVPNCPSFCDGFPQQENFFRIFLRLYHGWGDKANGCEYQLGTPLRAPFSYLPVSPILRSEGGTAGLQVKRKFNVFNGKVSPAPNPSKLVHPYFRFFWDFYTNYPKESDKMFCPKALRVLQETPYPTNSLLQRHDLDQKMSHFWTPADLKRYLEMASMALSHLAICKTKILVHYEFKVHINVVGRAKNLQK